MAKNKRKKHPMAEQVRQILRAWIDADPELSLKRFCDENELTYSQMHGLLNNPESGITPTIKTLDKVARACGWKIKLVK